jgi:Type VI secretion system/phage-baseplate injector OB domain
VPDTSEDKHRTMGSLGYREQFTWGSEQDPDPPVAKRHWGKYRGTVVDNQDLPPKGRLLVSVPGIVITNWATPCVPIAGVLSGSFVRPAIGSNVWVEFERGDPDKPIWVGSWWGDGRIPLIAEEYNALPVASVMTIESGSAGISVSDIPMAVGPNKPGNVNLKAGSGAVTIALGPDGVSINAPQVTITTTAPGGFRIVTTRGIFTVG